MLQVRLDQLRRSVGRPATDTEEQRLRAGMHAVVDALWDDGRLCELLREGRLAELAKWQQSLATLGSAPPTQT